VTLGDYVRILRERWIVVLVCLILGVGGAVAATVMTPPEYEAKVTMFISAQSGGDNASAFDGAQLSQQRIQSYATLLTNEEVSDGAIRRLGLDETPEELSRRITAEVDVNTVILSALVTDTSPDGAADIANATAASFISLVSELEQPADPAQPPLVTARVVRDATPPATAVSPQPAVNIGIGAVVGLLIGVAGAMLRNLMDNTVKTADSLRALVGAPELGHIVYDREVPTHPLTVHEHPHAARAEAFRSLRTNLQFIGVDHRPQVIVVTSSVPGEGKTTIACNLAIAMGDAGNRVLLIAADLRRPRIGDYLGLDEAVGLTTVLAGRLPVARAIQTVKAWGSGSFDVLATGAVPPNPSELLGSQQMAELLRDLRRRYEYILIDTPPLLPVSDAAAVAPRADGTILVVRHGRTTRNQVTRATESLDAVAARVLGTVRSMTPRKAERSQPAYTSFFTAGGDSVPVQSIVVPVAASSEPPTVRTPLPSSPLPSSPLPSSPPHSSSQASSQQAPMPSPRPRPRPDPSAAAEETAAMPATPPRAPVSADETADRAG
jgi:polysaccharide biosynthesis transport protein